MKFRNIFLGLLFISALTVSCEKDPLPTPAPTADRTILVYMLADNVLEPYFQNNVVSMLQGMKGQPGNLIVYFDSPRESPVLWKIEPDGKTKTTIKTYAEPVSDPAEVLGEVFRETQRLYPASSYGLVLSSHGKGWVPSSFDLQQLKSRPIGGQGAPSQIGAEPDLWQLPENGLITKALGPGKSKEIEMADLARVLPADRTLDFLLFDACFMSCVEVAYDLRSAAKYIIASPAEVLADGFPYKDIVPLFFREQLNPKAIGEAFMAYYRADTHPSAAVALVKTSEMDALAATVRGVFAANPSPAVDVSKVQSLELLSRHVFYDLDDYLSQVAPGSDAYNAFKQQLARTVVYADHTDQIYSAYGPTYFPCTRYCGLSSYIPRDNFPVYNAAYRATAWAQAIGLGQ